MRQDMGEEMQKRDLGTRDRAGSGTFSGAMHRNIVVAGAHWLVKI